MISFTAYPWKGKNQFRFDPLIKNDTYTFLYFIPCKDSPEKLRVLVSVYGNDELIEQCNFNLVLDASKNKYKEHYIGVQQNGTKQLVLFSTWTLQNKPTPEQFHLQVAVVKIRDGNDDNDGGVYLKPKMPKFPVADVCH